ncbi:MAG TPA: hypothetical protein VK116_20160 [Planctomycetota bacterium]|nr:hypothetical protein [Planctomycetota bacterium]
MRMALVAFGLAALIGMSAGCKGMRESTVGGKTTYVAHGISFRPLGLVALPADDLEQALSQLPADAQITDAHAPPTSWNSFAGIIHNIFVWFDVSHVSATK